MTPCPPPQPDTGLIALFAALAAMLGLVIGKTWGDRDRRIRITRRRRHRNV